MSQDDHEAQDLYRSWRRLGYTPSEAWTEVARAGLVGPEVAARAAEDEAAWRIAAAANPDADADTIERSLPKIKVQAAMRFFTAKLERMLKRRAALGLSLDPADDDDLAAAADAAAEEELATLVPGLSRIHDLHRAMPAGALFTYADDQKWRRAERSAQDRVEFIERLGELEAEGIAAKRASLRRRLETVELLREMALEDEARERRQQVRDIACKVELEAM